MNQRLRFPPDYSETRLLKDGSEVFLRLLRPHDRELVAKGFEELSPESRYRRFFSAMPHLPEGVLDRLLDTDDWNHLAIVASTASTRDAGHGIGIGRFIRLPNDPEVAEAAVAVVDSMQGRGLGKILLSLLTQAARERGITRFRAHVLRTNDAMVKLLHEINSNLPNLSATSDGGVLTYELELPEVTPEGVMSGHVFDILRAAGRGLQVLLDNLRQG